tara:strand:- start:142 stop:669 length:528 start_codon:yes stop_codon:yes gene_type:complete
MIKGKFVKFRSLESKDLIKLKEWRNENKVRKTTREYRLLSMINQKKWLEKLQMENPPSSIMFGIVNNNKILIGVCGLTYIDWKNKHAEISCYLKLKNWQKTKESKDTVETLMKYGFDELNLNRLWAEVFEIAKENIELLKKFNFIKEGELREKLWRDGKWWNSQIYSKLAKEFLK